MSESVNLPALGESVTEGTVTRWLKNVGDSVEVDEPLLEVSTDKVDTEIPSPVAGVVEEILVAEDETVEVGTALVRIGDGSGGGAAPADHSATETSGSDAEDSAPAEAQAEAAAADAAQADATPAEPASAPAPAAPEEPTAAEPAGGDDATDDDSSPESASSGEDSAPIEEVPSNDAPAPGEEGAETPSAPDPADAVDAPPAAAPPAAAAPAPSAPAAPQAPAPGSDARPTPVASSDPAPAVPNGEGSPSAGAPSTKAPSAGASNAGYVTPLVRRLANEKGVDLSTVTGTGVGGRIRKEDVLAAQAPAASGAPTASDAPAGAEVPKPLETSPLRGTTVPMSRLRKVIADRAVQSMQASAQLTSVVEVDVTRVAQFRDSVKGAFQEKTGAKLSFLPFFALAASEALKAYPIVNAAIDTESNSIVYPDHENLSIAVDTERGLLTPVIRNASDQDLAGLAQQIADLAERTRENKLKPDELAGGTFTLTNTGSRGALFDTPLVFMPQSAILGTGIVAKKPVVISQGGTDAIAIRSMVYLALSYDHRIVDGADAARFLVAVKNRLEAGQFEANLGI